MDTVDRTASVRMAVYQAYAAMHGPDYPDDGPGLPITPELVRDVRRVVMEQGTWVRVREVEAWLSNPRKWSPFPDVIALKRALRWDWGVVENLSDTERVVLARILARHPDPVGAVHGGSRRAAWLRGSPNARRCIQDQLLSLGVSVAEAG